MNRFSLPFSSKFVTPPFFIAPLRASKLLLYSLCSGLYDTFESPRLSSAWKNDGRTVLAVALDNCLACKWGNENRKFYTNYPAFVEANDVYLRDCNIIHRRSPTSYPTHWPMWLDCQEPTVKLLSQKCASMPMQRHTSMASPTIECWMQLCSEANSKHRRWIVELILGSHLSVGQIEKKEDKGKNSRKMCVGQMWSTYNWWMLYNFGEIHVQPDRKKHEKCQPSKHVQ